MNTREGFTVLCAGSQRAGPSAMPHLPASDLRASDPTFASLAAPLAPVHGLGIDELRAVRSG